ncbi:hypothetical protein [Bacillus salacetis]|nr:hypothetical protein [Bacillus salacetis]
MRREDVQRMYRDASKTRISPTRRKKVKETPQKSTFKFKGCGCGSK